MSVLIEALTLVVPKDVLDVSYPGGADAYLETLLHLEKPPRFICNADAKLVNVSFYDPEHMNPATDLLEKNGVVAVDDNKFIELAIVDQRHGPTMPCEWLEWRRHRDGFTYAWLTGTEAGDMAAPSAWTVEQSRQLTRTDIRDEPGRCMRLAEEDGIETWIDFKTGQMSAGLPQEHEPGAAPDIGSSDVGPLMPVVTAALRERGLTFIAVSATNVTVRVRDGHGTYDVLIVTNDVTRVVRCDCIYSACVPAERRAAVVEALNLVNWQTALGNFELDATNGEVRFRISIDVEGGLLAPRMMHNMLSAGLYAADRYHEAVMRVAFGGADPDVVAGDP